MPTTTTSRGSETATAGVRVVTSPFYLADRSDPDAKRWVFGYRITITNERENGSAPVQLLSRRWLIVDAEGERHVVEGEGVIGRQPTLAPGESHEYSSFCPLHTAWGTMEGSYRFRVAGADGDESGEEFDAAIGRFFLVAGSEARATKAAT